MMYSDEIRFPDGPEEEDLQNAPVRVICWGCNLAGTAQFDGWECEDCGREVELEVEVEWFRHDEYVAGLVDHPVLHAVGHTPEVATARLYEMAKEYAPGPDAPAGEERQ